MRSQRIITALSLIINFIGIANSQTSGSQGNYQYFIDNHSITYNSNKYGLPKKEISGITDAYIVKDKLIIQGLSGAYNFNFKDKKITKYSPPAAIYSQNNRNSEIWLFRHTDNRVGAYKCPETSSECHFKFNLNEEIQSIKYIFIDPAHKVGLIGYYGGRFAIINTENGATRCMSSVKGNITSTFFNPKTSLISTDVGTFSINSLMCRVISSNIIRVKLRGEGVVYINNRQYMISDSGEIYENIDSPRLVTRFGVPIVLTIYSGWR